MAQVTLRINGYAYTLGCQDGEEEHLHAMAAEVDQRIEGVKASAGPSGEARMLVIAALTSRKRSHGSSRWKRTDTAMCVLEEKSSAW